MPTYEEMRKILNEVNKEHKKLEEKWEKIKWEEWEQKEIRPMRVDMNKIETPRCDHPNTMEGSTATVLWIIVMLVGSIFKGNWLIWIIATVIWAKFITRYKK